MQLKKKIVEKEDLDIGATEEDTVDKKLLTSKFLEERNQRLMYPEDDGKDKGASFEMKAA